MAQDVIKGLGKPQKCIPPKYFYDEKGSQLFDQICQLREYYPTRTEMALLQAHREDFAQCISSNGTILELGSGSSLKIRLLLEAVRPAAYVAVDISKAHLLQAVQALARRYPWLEVHAVCADLTTEWKLPFSPKGAITAFYPGSSIGNFSPSQAVQLLTRVAHLVGSGGGLLIGVDLKKDTSILERAYNDAKGITAAFNFNLLERINRELQGNFVLNQFTHVARYNQPEGRIEMHLVSLLDQEVSVGGKSFAFKKGESLHTENSYKYHVEEFQMMAKQAGFLPQKVWVDDQNLFSIHYLEAENPSIPVTE